MAASAAIAPLLTGRPRRVEVAVVTPSAVYLTTGDPDLPALCLATHAAIRVPCAVLLPSLPGTAVGAVGVVGAGALTLGGFTGRVTRWWAPPRPVGLDSAPAHRLRELAAALRERTPGTLVPIKNVPFHALAGHLVGRGPGLTPFGDDVLAGLLVTLRALAAGEADSLAARVCARSGGTTIVSAALLRHAARGECVPQLSAVLTAPRREAPPGPAIEALLRVGHTSGAGLAHGVRVALARRGIQP